MYDRSLDPGNMPQLAALTILTSLTWLSLYGISLDPRADMRPVQKMGLIQLDLHCCLGVAEALLVSGALSSLEVLFLYEEDHYILDDDGDVIDLEEASEDVVEARNVKAEELGRVVFGHPSLVEVYGASRIFSIDIPDRSRCWQFCPSESNSYQVWKKIV